MGAKDRFEHPLGSRYGSKEMSYIWSPDFKFTTWRKLWVALAQAELELGVKGVEQEQVDQLRSNITNIDYEFAESKEKELRHDVMSHIHAFGKACPDSMKILHLGATSCFITDNTELIQIQNSLIMISQKLSVLLKHLAVFADKFKDMPTLGFTHYQPAQLTTVGKRSCLWLQDFIIDAKDLEALIPSIPFRGVKGTTGTQASFLALFEGNHEAVRNLDAKVAEAMGFKHRFIITGQTYTRKIDYRVVSLLASIAQSAHKMGSDIRLLSNLKELEEPFGTNQVGSSAMAYKRNPMRCERMCSISRFIMSLVANTMNTHANQWLERTLDDSANRRMTLPEAFLACDAVLDLAVNVVSGLCVLPLMIQKVLFLSVSHGLSMYLKSFHLWLLKIF